MHPEGLRGEREYLGHRQTNVARGHAPPRRTRFAYDSTKVRVLVFGAALTTTSFVHVC